MPVYNGEKYLSEAIESLLEQTLRDFELIIINDASTDQTENIIRKFQKNDKRIKLLENEFEKGIVGGLNTGLKNAQGDYIARADADDIFLPHRLERQIDFLQTNPQVDVLGSAFVLFDKNGVIKKSKSQTGSIWLAWKFVSNTFLCHPSVMFRKKVLQTISQYPQETAEDFAFFSKIIPYHQTENLKEQLIYYRKHANKLSMQKRAEIASSVKTTFRKNYEYYLGNLKNAEVFFDFQNKNFLKTKNLPGVLLVNWKILKQIKQNYGLNSLNLLFWYNTCKIELKTIFCCIHSSVISFIKYLLNKESQLN